MWNDYLLFFFSALGAFNGLALALYLWLSSEHLAQHRFDFGPQRWLAIVILLVSIRTGKSVAFHFLPDTPAPVMQAGLTACLLIGPALYFFIRAGLTSAATLRRAEIFHAGGWLSVALVINLLWPYGSFADIWHGAIVKIVTWGWLGYLLLSSLLLWRYYQQAASSTRWLLLSVTGGLWLIWLAYFTSGFTSYIVGALSFSLVIYLGLAFFWAKRQGLSMVAPYQDRRIDAHAAAAELQTLDALMAQEKLYLDPALTLTRLARRLGMPQARLSQLLNDNNGTSYKEYLTRWRLNAAEHLLRQSPEQTMEVIAEAAGFQSMSTFYAAFKKAYQCTPAAWRAALVTQTALATQVAPATPQTGFHSPKTHGSTVQ